MANGSGNYTVYVPDRSEAFTGFPRTMTVEEVRSSLVATGHTALENADIGLSADGGTIRFKRVTGGNKGV